MERLDWMCEWMREAGFVVLCDTGYCDKDVWLMRELHFSLNNWILHRFLSCKKVYALYFH